MVGQTISHYRIVEKLGEGGMGVVYKAEDTKLRRTVALKFLRSDILASPEHKERLLREAQATAALDHPNICTVYEIDEAESQTFLAMAFVEGRSLKDRIAERPLKLEEALDVAIQTAQGLQIAHERGIVHRDIKPANLVINPQRQVKILDFGLAQLGNRSRLTKTSTLLGTPSYMSPEQAERAPADRRTDIWSLGAVLYEMVTGRAPFEGEREAAVLHAIVHSKHEPVTALRSGLPTELDRILAKSLAKDPAERYQHADDMLVDLRTLRTSVDSGAHSVAPAPVKPQSRRWVWGMVAGLVAVFAVILLMGGLLERGSETKPTAAPLQSRPLTSLAGREENPALSPDGTHVAYSWSGETGDNVDIYVQVVGSTNNLRLTTDPASDVTPAWSPDGSQVAFVRHSGSTRSIHLISPLGGPETRVAAISGFGGALWREGLAWHPDGRSIFYSESESAALSAAIYRLWLETGDKDALTFPPAGSTFSDLFPAVSPDGRILAFARGSLLSSEIWLLVLEDGGLRQLTSQGEQILGLAWTPDSREIVYSRGRIGFYGRRLWRVPVEGGLPQLLAEAGGDGLFPTISQRGRRLAYQSTDDDSNVWLYPIPSQENGESPRAVAASTYRDSDPQISPDGTRIAFNSTRSGTFGVWICDRDGSNPRMLSSPGVPSGSPRWSPESDRIVFDSPQQGDWDIYVVDVLGGAPRPLTGYEGHDSRPSWSQDGRWIYFGSDREGGPRIWKVPSDGGEAVPVTQGPVDLQPSESPDGRFLYFSRRGQRSGELWRVPVDGGKESFTGLEFPFSVGTAWDVTDSGIYFLVPRESPDLTRKWFLRLLRHDAPEPVDVMEVPTPAGGATLFDIARDEKWFVYAQGDQIGSDLMVLENFE